MSRHLFVCALLALTFTAQAIDMQTHMAADEAKQAYQTYAQKQAAYYTGTCSYANLIQLTGNDLFGALNEKMGQTINESQLNYDKLRDAYVNVDRDLNKSGNIIGYYDGYSFAGIWDSGKTWNREHTWPQSKGANKSTPMGSDMQSVRPTRTAVNSSRGNTPYGEGSSYYNPDRDCSINNPLYVASNNGTYRGDAARVILYDYVVYGERGGHQNQMYLGNAQLLSKLGTNGVFESIDVLLKWHMQDPPSLTEMVRNDGAENYQGNRNPFIDYPELAVSMLKDNAGRTYTVTNQSGFDMAPAYTYTLSAGFVCYVTTPVGSHPAQVPVTGATASYDPTNGRLTLTNVTGPVVIGTPSAMNEMEARAHAHKYIRSGRVVLTREGRTYSVLGTAL